MALPTPHPHQEMGWQRFITLCLNMRNKEDLMALFDLFLTEEEKETLSTRTLIIDALLDGTHPQRAIAENLKVSISKITRGSNMLKRTSSLFLKKLIELGRVYN